MLDVTCNREAELAVIGIAIQDAGCAAQVAALPEKLFTATETYALHAGVRRLVQSGKLVDAVSLLDAARCAELPEPTQMIAQAMQAGFSPAMLGTHIAILTECRKRRLAKAVAGKILTEAASPGTDIDDMTARAVAALQSQEDMGGSVDMQQALIAFMDGLNKAGEGRCYTGIADFDCLTGGVKGGKLIILAARPGVGKSALAQQMARYVALHTGPVLMASLEMGAEEIVARMVAAAACVPVDRLESGQMTEDDYAAIVPCYQQISTLPIRIAERAATPMQLRREAMAMRAKDGLAMVVVDYLQLMRADNRHGSRYEDVTEISRELKLLAMDLHVPVIALSQVNRQSEAGVGGKAEKRMPSMSEAKDSGAIEQDANLYMTLYEPAEPTDTASADWNGFHACKINDWTYMHLAVQKNRQGRTGVIRLAFDKPQMQFMCLAK